MSEANGVKDAIAQHPRLIGFLFATMVLLNQAGAVAAGGSGTSLGP